MTIEGSFRPVSTNDRVDHRVEDDIAAGRSKVIESSRFRTNQEVNIPVDGGKPEKWVIIGSTTDPEKGTSVELKRNVQIDSYGNTREETQTIPLYVIERSNPI